MNTAEIINTVCTRLDIPKAELAKRMGMLPSSLYRKLARESMTLKELQTYSHHRPYRQCISGKPRAGCGGRDG